MSNFVALFTGGLLRARGMLWASLAVSVGVVLLTILATGSSGQDITSIKVGFIDRDGSAVAADFSHYLTDDLGIELVRSSDVDEMNTKLVDKHISGIVEMPGGFEAALLSGAAKAVELTFMGDYANEVFTRGYIESYMQSVGVVSLAADGDAAAFQGMLERAGSERVLVGLAEKDEDHIKEQADKEMYRFVIGFFMMFGFIMSIGIAMLLFSDRRDGTYERIRAGRVTSFEYISSVAAVGLVLMALIGGPAFALYALTGGDPGVPITVTAGLLAAYSLFVIAFGLLAGLVMPSHGGIIAVIIAVTTLTSMVGGAWFPIDMAPKAFQALGHITPQYWLFEAVDAWQSGGGGAAGPVLIILLAAALLFVFAGVRFASNKGAMRV